jgi:hypothetical protein
MIGHILTRCHCFECEALDKLPARKQGILGSYQMTFDNVRSIGRADCAMNYPEADEYQAIRPSQKAVDDLPLFGGGSDQPDLF